MQTLNRVPTVSRHAQLRAFDASLAVPFNRVLILVSNLKSVIQRKQQLAKSRWCSWLSRGSHITTYDCSQSRNPKAASSSLARDSVFLFVISPCSCRFTVVGRTWGLDSGLSFCGQSSSDGQGSEHTPAYHTRSSWCNFRCATKKADSDNQ
jgi:hypothetical protein